MNPNDPSGHNDIYIGRFPKCYCFKNICICPLKPVFNKKENQYDFIKLMSHVNNKCKGLKIPSPDLLRGAWLSPRPSAHAQSAARPLSAYFRSCRPLPVAPTQPTSFSRGWRAPGREGRGGGREGGGVRPLFHSK